MATRNTSNSVGVMRKKHKKARLLPAREGPPEKRRKLNKEDYVSIKEVWGAPTTTLPEKRGERSSSTERSEQNRMAEKRQRRGETPAPTPTEMQPGSPCRRG